MIGSNTILLKRGNNAYTFTWVFLDQPVAECFAQAICRLLNSQGAQAVTGKPYLVTMCGGLGSAASQPLCFPSSTCHLSSSHPIRCIYLGQKGLPVSHIINILQMRNPENTEILNKIPSDVQHMGCQHSGYVWVSGTNLTSHHFLSG